ncbi:homoserine dehydrogenase [Marvinbryantia formatexigens DSM 14469]|uniref:Homoserine dehydrogenase n=2 Tax=Marvinbryantia TaxID=248744 RepID=C6LIZ4_9FIRM|nr:homoserine dehydrogenase [Marvinbryantia formatexigens DSM 14469]
MLRKEKRTDMRDNKIQIALLGLGTVGTGVYKVLESQKEEMLPKLGVELEVKKILVRNLEKAAAKVDRSLLTNNWQEIVEDEEIDIVIEVMGGMEPARTYMLEALRAGKNVVTANKDLIATDGKTLMDAAKEAQRDFFFEASVAGGIPIIRPLKQSLEGNHISEIVGIVNGTTNFILTKMTEENMEFDEALALATKLGYAEADPTADIEGLDAARKIAILASIAFNSRVTFSDVYTEGITKVTARDIRYAGEMGCVIKLVGVARSTQTGIEVSVHPMLIDSRHPLASVNDSYNAVFVHGDAVGDTMFYGRGAGELPTASAVVGDVFDIAKNMLYHCTGHVNCTCYKTIPVKKMDDIVSRYFMRLQVEDRPGVLAGVTSVFGNNNVSIEQFIQKRKEGTLAEIVVITEEVVERNFNDSLKILRTMSMIKEISAVIRVY